jgi:NAD(P)-dependent dehydrogenase (short-subunit alcohol dehydrogenase family)
VASARTRDTDGMPTAEHDASDVVALVELVQSLEHRVPGRTSSLLVITDRLYRVGGGEVLDPSGAPAAMATIVVGQEHAGLHTASLDIDRGALGVAPGSAAALVAAVQDELAADLPDRIVALRGPLRFTPALASLAPGPLGQHRRWIDPAGTYVITGGLGAIGLAIAGLMARTAPGVCLVLMSRRELALCDAVLDLERAGARVVVVRADASTPAELRSALERARAERGRIDGVLHAAGIAEGRIVQLEDPARIARVIGAKLTSARVLAALADELGVGFVALFSSLNGLSGGAGHLAYAAANAGLDALAQARWGHPGARFVSINWGTWQIGMMDPVRGARGLSASPDPDSELSPVEGFDALGWVLDQTDLPQVTAAKPVDMGQLLDAVSAPAAASTAADPEPAAPAAEDDVRSAVVAAWTDVLGHRDIPLDANVFALGADSLICVQLVRLLSQRLGIRVPVTDVFECPTVAGLIEAIQRRIADRAGPPAATAAAATGEAPPDPTATDDVLRASIERGRMTRERRRGRS